MAEAWKALPGVMEHEGGFVDDPADRGGTTNYGISLRFLRAAGVDINEDGAIDGLDIRVLTREQAGELFVEHFWRFDGIREQAVANKLFDIAVNMSLAAAVKLAQRVLVSQGWAIAVDGVLGEATLKGINALEPEVFLRELRILQAARYAEIAVADPSQRKFLNGWMRRAMA